MILKRKTQNAISLKLVLLFLVSPLIFKSQNTLPTTTITGCLKVDSTMSTSNLQSTGNLSVDGTTTLDSSLTVNADVKTEDLVVSGTAKISGDINLSGKLLFDPSNSLGMGFVPGSANGTGSFFLGKSVAGAVPCAAAPQSGLNFSIGANLQIFDQNNPTGSGLLNLQTWTGGSSIDASTGGSVSASGLLLNYWCGNNTFINTGTNGGAVYVGNDFYARKNVQIGNPGPNPLDPNVSLNLFLNGTTSGLKLWSGAIPTVKLIHDNYDQFMVMGNGKTSIGVNSVVGATPYKTLTVNGDASFANYGAADGLNAFEIVGNNQKPLFRGISVDNNPSGSVNFWINSNQTLSAFKFRNSANNFNLMTLDINGKLSLLAYSSIAFQVGDPIADQVTFTIKNNGQTFIGVKKVQTSNAHSNAMLQVDGKIACKELVVLDPSKWADFVFEKNYKLASLSEVEKYYLEHKHLKDVPSEREVKENGINSSEMDAILLQKIEELTIYTVELNKQIQQLKNENVNLKNHSKNK